MSSLALEEARPVWQELAEKHRMRYVAAGLDGLPSLEGRTLGTDVGIFAVGTIAGGLRTRATANANIPLRGSLRVRPRGWFGKVFRGRFFHDRELDQLLAVKTSSEGLAQTVLDTRVLETVRVLAPRRLELSYTGGVIVIEWAGLERSKAILHDVVDALAYLAVRSEGTPYR